MKKGFTLIELLAVIILLALISSVTIPIISSSLNKYRKSLCNTQLKEIEEAARSWGVDHIALLPETDGDSYDLYLSKLISSGLIDEEIKNPVTKENFDPDATYVTITKNGNKYTYTMDATSSKLCE